MSAYATTSLNPEPNLVTQARAGDADAFAVLYETHRPRIQAICLRMTNNMAEAEDLTQDAFIYAFRKLSTFRGESAFSTWLHRVAVNTVLMHFRRKGNRHVSLEQPSPQDSDGPKREYGRVDENLAGCADRLTLAQALEELPPGYRTIFLLHEVQGYEHQEIARRLNCSIGNSKSQLHKAKLRMRELLGSRGYSRRKKVAVRPTAFHGTVSVEITNVGSLVVSSAEASPRLSKQLLGIDSNERKRLALMRTSAIASSTYEKQLRIRKDSTDPSIVGDPEMMIPAIRQANLGLLAESGS